MRSMPSFTRHNSSSKMLCESSRKVGTSFSFCLYAFLRKDQDYWKQKLRHLLVYSDLRAAPNLAILDWFVFSVRYYVIFELSGVSAISTFLH